MLLLDCYSAVCYSMVTCSCSRPDQSFAYSLWRVKDCLVSTEFYLLLFWHASSDGIYGNTLPSALSWSIPCLQVDYPSVSETLFIASIKDPHATRARCQDFGFIVFPTAFLLSLSLCHHLHLDIATNKASSPTALASSMLSGYASQEQRQTKRQASRWRRQGNPGTEGRRQQCN